MKDKKIVKFINKVKYNLSRSIVTYPSINDCAFSAEELASISKQNRQKIEKLKKEDFIKKEEKKLYLPDIISPIEGIIKNNEESTDEVLSEKEKIDLDIEEVSEDSTKKEVTLDYEEDILTEKEEKLLEEFELKEVTKENLEVEEDNFCLLEDILENVEPKNSYVHLNEENKRIVMSKWMEIDIKHIDKDIINGKDLLNHNYTITYADDAAKFVHNIRKKYEVVICYLIGFNNEKKGVYDKTIFSDKMDDEWKHLNNYIKILEKIRSFRK